MRQAPATLLALALLGCPKTAPVDAVGSLPDLDAPLPVDPGVRIGVLDNGLTYYLEHHDEPEDRAVLRLVVDVGSVLEDDDQRGVAHLLEHMAFNGSEHFAGNELIDVMQAMGMRFGAHVNAHTSFDETVYKLTVPTDQPELLDKALLIFEDWAGGLTLDPGAIDAERGVVIEEWRRGLGPSKRVSEQALPLTYFGSPYHERLPIGTLESLQTFTPEAVARFYEDWYRPDLMAVVAVGDFDVDQMEAEIRARFGALTNPTPARQRVRPPVPDHEPLYKVVTDPELPQTFVAAMHKFDDPQGQTHRTYRTSLLEGLVDAVLNERLAAIAREPGAPFLGASGSERRMAPAEGAWTLGAVAREGEVLVAYEAALTEAERLTRHGITQPELDRARTNLLRRFEASLEGLANESSIQAAEELVRVFTTHECVPGIAYEVMLAQTWLPAVTLDEVNALARERLTRGSRVVVVTMPDKEGVTPPTVEELQAVEARVASLDIAPPVVEDAVEPPIDTPAPGRVVATDTSLLEPLGFTRWTLSNGIEVYWKKTDFKDDEVVFRGRSPGGLDKVPDADWVAAATAVSLASASGAGALDMDALNRWNAGRMFRVGVGLGGDDESFSGSASPKDLEHALTLLHAKVVAPRFDPDAFEVAKVNRAEQLRNRLLNPAQVFSDAWQAALWPDDPRRVPWTEQTLDAMDLARSEAVYRERLADLHDAQFVFVGALPDDFERLVTTWIATLPGGDRADDPKDRGFRMAKGPISLDERVGKDPKAQVWLTWHGPFPDPSFLTRNRYEALEAVLSERLREELREAKSGVYGVSVNSTVRHWPVHAHQFSISFTCDPERADELADEALRVVEELKAAPPAASYVQKVTEQRKRSHDEQLRSNAYWQNVLLGALERGEDPVDAVLGYVERAESLTPEDIQAAARRYLSSPNFVRAVQRPEGE